MLSALCIINLMQRVTLNISIFISMTASESHHWLVPILPIFLRGQVTQRSPRTPRTSRPEGHGHPAWCCASG